MNSSDSFKLKTEKITTEKVFSWILIIGVLVGVYFGISYFSGPNWSLFFYPDGCLSCQSEWIIEVDKYDSQGACEDAGDALRIYRGNPNDTFECGYKCEAYDSSGYLCKETVDF